MSDNIPDRPYGPDDDENIPWCDICHDYHDPDDEDDNIRHGFIDDIMLYESRGVKLSRLRKLYESAWASYVRRKVPTMDMQKLAKNMLGMEDV